MDISNGIRHLTAQGGRLRRRRRGAAWLLALA